jgi:ketosteroid isomerase-like protein
MPSPEPAAVLQEINRIWQMAQPNAIAELIAPYFTDDAVVVAPNLARVAGGRAAVAASYAEFAASAKLLEVHIEEPEVDFFGDVAVATMPWRMSYEFEGRRSSERGSDTYVFRLDDGRWQICWRSMVSAAAT